MQNRCVEHNAVVFHNTFTILLLLCINSVLFQSRLRYHSQFVHLVQMTVLNKSVTQFEVLLYNSMGDIFNCVEIAFPFLLISHV